MNIRLASEYVTPLLNTIDQASKNAACIKFSKISIESCFTEIDKLTHTSKKIATACFALFASLFIAANSIAVAIEVAARTIKEIGARVDFHQTSHKVAACFSAAMIAPGIALSYAVFSFASILEESIKRFKEPAPLPQVVKEAAAL
jgi:cell division protein FtsX